MVVFVQHAQSPGSILSTTKRTQNCFHSREMETETLRTGKTGTQKNSLPTPVLSITIGSGRTQKLAASNWLQTQKRI